MRRLLRSLDADTEQYEDTLLDRVITGVSTDTRTIGDGDVFFAIRGERFDGADFVDSAFEDGAILAVVDEGSREKIPSGKPVAFVDDTVQALGKAAGDYRRLYNGAVVGITGTTGKTTVKEMIKTVLETGHKVHSSRENYNNQIGLPLSVFEIDDCHEYAVLEMGMSAPGEIAYLAGIAKPEIGVVLNVGPAHMEFFESLDEIADAKAEILAALDERGTAVINGDDELVRSRESLCRGRVVRFGIEGSWEYRAEHVVVHPDGCASFEIEGNVITLRVPGRHNVYNALAAYTVGRIMGIDGRNAAAALEKVEPVSMRLERFERDGVLYINDSYNANPLSMKAAADVLEHTDVPPGGRKIAVLGDMLELGSITGQAHREAGELFASLGIDLLCVVGEFAGLYAEGAVRGGMSPEAVKKFPRAADASAFVESIKRTGDVLLVKGSRALGMEEIVMFNKG